MAEAQGEAPKQKGPSLKWSTLPPMPTARVYCSSLWHDGRLYVFGGCDQMGRALTVAESFNPSNGKWLSLPKMPNKRAGGRLVALPDGRLALIGGIDGAHSSVGAVDAYNPKSGKWESLKRLPQALSSPSVVVADSLVYLFGGAPDSSKPPTKLALCYSHVTNTWNSLPDMPTARYGGEVVRRGDKVYLFGGRAMKESVLAVDVFDLSSKTWGEPLPPIPTPRVFWCLADHEDEVFIIGGFSEPSGFRSQVEVFSFKENKWEIARPLKIRRGDFACGIVSGCLVVAGGMGGDKDSGLNHTERMRLKTTGTRKWTSIDVLPDGPRLAPTSFVHENKLYVVGGFGIGGPKPSVFALGEV